MHSVPLYIIYISAPSIAFCCNPLGNFEWSSLQLANPWMWICLKYYRMAQTSKCTKTSELSTHYKAWIEFIVNNVLEKSARTDNKFNLVYVYFMLRWNRKHLRSVFFVDILYFVSKICYCLIRVGIRVELIIPRKNAIDNEINCVCRDTWSCYVIKINTGILGNRWWQ